MSNAHGPSNTLLNNKSPKFLLQLLMLPFTQCPMSLPLKRQLQLPKPEPKRKKTEHSVCEAEAQRPAEFWDNLSQIWLTKKALRELDRRNTHQRPHVIEPYRPITRQISAERRKNVVAYAPEFLSSCKPDCLDRVRRFARHGGPDLSDLRNFRQDRIPLYFKMPKRPLADTTPSSVTRSKRSSQSTGAYSLGFEQHLIDHFVYPHGYEYPDDRIPEKPSNWDQINNVLDQSRGSLSPSKFGDEEFRQFERANTYATSEKKITKIIESLEGGSDDRAIGGDYPFGNFRPLTDGTIPSAKPDHFHGSRPEELNGRIRDELNDTIIPSTAASRPMLPNYFLEIKTPDQSAAVAKRQACYDGALGARAMQSLQSFWVNPVYDNNAYTITSTYHDGTLKLYTSHPTAPSCPESQPEYFMTQLNGWNMTGNLKMFREGATAYRNARDWAKEKRKGFIEAANTRFLEPKPQSVPSSLSGGTITSTVEVAVIDSDISTNSDETEYLDAQFSFKEFRNSKSAD
ncbi:conserved hypothetical protein [Histoplasma capsulatum var. duboisii H88]|uniref:Uncharacterized protein n=1 Tax=Ajellomyces capsulatus (strain H88) TaxID=544711 RepID=F0USH2_AJEC8|nr:conserved hypothetical protein [Histoplasma capsulatum var. duboisii H88]QSS54446.1 hypothetical protein I7I53_01990 [Histoplasma capsulatum var. duboisii H88]